MVDRAFPDLEEAAKETLALNQYLAQLGGTQIALSVRLQRPKILVEAVSFTVEMESYLHKPHKVSHVDVTEEASPIAAIQTQQNHDGNTRGFVPAVAKIGSQYFLSPSQAS